MPLSVASTGEPRDLYENMGVAAKQNAVRISTTPDSVPASSPETLTTQTDIRPKLVEGINASFRKETVVGYAEISGDDLTVHSERASAMRFHMMLANQQWLSLLRRAGIATVVYTDDADQRFVYDVKSGSEGGGVAKQKATTATTADPSRHCTKYLLNIDGHQTCSAWSSR